MSSTSVTPAPAPGSKPPTAEELLKLLNDVQKLNDDKKAREEAEAKKAASAKTVKASTEPSVDDIDWSNISEKDVFDLSVPIPAIEQTLPNYMDVHLLDKNYVARWVSTLKERLGPMRQAGFDFVTEKDIDPNFPMTLLPDASGHYTYMDVVALKVPKARLYPALRKNHLKSAQIHGANAVKSRLNNQIANSPSVEGAFRRGALSVYEDETKEDTVASENLTDVNL